MSGSKNDKLSKVRKANVGNLIKHLHSGKPLTAAQISLVEKELGGEVEQENQETDPMKLPLTADQFASLVNLDKRRVQQLAKQGVIEKEGRGKYPISEITSYIRYLQELVQQRKIAAQPAEGSLNPEHERARKDAATADKLEMDLAERRGELLEAKDAEEEWTKAVMAIRSGALSLPSRMAEELARTNDARQVKELLRVEVYEILEELSEYGSEEDSPESDGAAGSST